MGSAADERRVRVELGQGLTVETVTIADLREQPLNAHIMPPAIFERLVENIRKRGQLESLPYCAQPQGQGPIEIVSGHHRIRAARKAGLSQVDVLVDRSNLTRSQITAKQLAHNALVGSDDTELVKQLVTKLTSVDDLLESGLDESLLPTAERHAVTLFTPHADYKWRTVTLTFLTHQVAKLEELAKVSSRQTDLVCVACEQQFDPFVKAVARYSREKRVISAGTAVAVLTETALNEAAAAQEEREAAEQSAETALKQGVLLSSLFGTTRVPKEAAAVIRQAVKAMVAREDVSEKAKWQAIELWAADYLAGVGSQASEPREATA